MSTPQKNPLVLLSYGTILALWIGSQVVDIPYVVNLMLLVTAILYAACHLSLTLREEQALARGETPKDKKDDDEEEEETEAPAYETMKASDAMQFPLIGSCSLFGLYCAFKYFDKDTVNLIISVYFCLVGLAALTATFGPALESMAPDGILAKRHSWHCEMRHPLPEFLGGASPWKIGVDFTVADFVAFMGSAAFVVVYFTTKHW
eukprot:CAMPEP_0181132114 /NCGR_PEP_ID=MMETSP1071-20121207/30823_1 /TAXON_ID=35127 /ORGANISM="Thalassiosira sp., Strain NH16" /LENGTH=204 /DNA_ID=CAMNT_0023218427 /DNA_START=27 /DNA_END=638 /DNA_ORIENTATION=-